MINESNLQTILENHIPSKMGRDEAIKKILDLLPRKPSSIPDMIAQSFQEIAENHGVAVQRVEVTWHRYFHEAGYQWPDVFLEYLNFEGIPAKRDSDDR